MCPYTANRSIAPKIQGEERGFRLRKLTAQVQKRPGQQVKVHQGLMREEKCPSPQVHFRTSSFCVRPHILLHLTDTGEKVPFDSASLKAGTNARYRKSQNWDFQRGFPSLLPSNNSASIVWQDSSLSSDREELKDQGHTQHRRDGKGLRTAAQSPRTLPTDLCERQQTGTHVRTHCS